MSLSTTCTQKKHRAEQLQITHKKQEKERLEYVKGTKCHICLNNYLTDTDLFVIKEMCVASQRIKQTLIQEITQNNLPTESLSKLQFLPICEAQSVLPTKLRYRTLQGALSRIKKYGLEPFQNKHIVQTFSLGASEIKLGEKFFTFQFDDYTIQFPIVYTVFEDILGAPDTRIQYGKITAYDDQLWLFLLTCQKKKQLSLF